RRGAARRLLPGQAPVSLPHRGVPPRRRDARRPRASALRPRLRPARGGRPREHDVGPGPPLRRQRLWYVPAPPGPPRGARRPHRGRSSRRRERNRHRLSAPPPAPAPRLDGVLSVLVHLPLERLLLAP